MLRLLADVLVVLHLAFVVFVVLGGLLVIWRRWLLWLHLPAAAWGVAVEIGGWVCPLTPLESYLRRRAGDAAYRGDFIEHYVLPLLYPGRLTRADQLILGAAALAINLAVYVWVFRKRRRA